MAIVGWVGVKFGVKQDRHTVLTAVFKKVEQMLWIRRFAEYQAALLPCGCARRKAPGFGRFLLEGE